MSSLLNWKKKCEAKLKRHEETQIKISTSSSSRPYSIPAGWSLIMSDDECPEYYFGLHHQYKGIKLNPKRYPKIFAGRDIILSLLFAYGRIPENSQESYESSIFIIDLFCDVGGWKSPTHHEGRIYEYLRKGLNQICSNYSTVPETELDQSIQKHFENENGELPTGDTLHVLWNEFRQNGVKNDASQKDVDVIILLCSIYEIDYAKFDLESSLLFFLMAIVKTGTVSQDYIDNRFTSFSKVMETEGFFSTEPASVKGIENVWKVIKYHLDHDTTTIDHILNNLTTVMSSIQNVVIEPMTGFLAYRGLTPIVMVAQAINSYPSFPWKALIKSNQVIKSEFINYKSILQITSNDVLLGYKMSGAGSSVPNLCYLAVCLMIKIGGNTTMEKYKGIGPLNKSKVTCCAFLDSLIEGFKADLLAGQTSYQKLKDQEDRLKDVLQSSGLNELMSLFLSRSSNQEEDEKNDKDFQFSDDGDSGDDDDNPPPPPPAKKSPRKRVRYPTSSSEDIALPEPPPKKPGSGGSMMYQESSEDRRRDEELDDYGLLESEDCVMTEEQEVQTPGSSPLTMETGIPNTVPLPSEATLNLHRLDEYLIDMVKVIKENNSKTSFMHSIDLDKYANPISHLVLGKTIIALKVPLPFTILMSFVYKHRSQKISTTKNSIAMKLNVLVSDNKEEIEKLLLVDPIHWGNDVNAYLLHNDWLARISWGDSPYTVNYKPIVDMMISAFSPA